MSLTPEDIAHQHTLLDFYEKEAEKHTEIIRLATSKLRQYQHAIKNTKALLQAEGVEV